MQDEVDNLDGCKACSCKSRLEGIKALQVHSGMFERARSCCQEIRRQYLAVAAASGRQLPLYITGKCIYQNHLVLHVHFTASDDQYYNSVCVHWHSLYRILQQHVAWKAACVNEHIVLEQHQ